MSLLVALLFAACQTDDPAPLGPGTEVSVQRVRTGVAGTDTYLSLAVLVTDPEGEAIPCGDDRLVMTVSWSTSGEDGPWTELEPEAFTHVCNEAPRGDVSLVVDNSGSEDGYLEQLQGGAQVMTDSVLGAGGRAALVRVSTNATVEQALTGDTAQMNAALADLYIGNGWTALWDGVRMGNETLGPQTDTPADLEDFCGQTGRLGVVVFTDGQENNSADQNDYDHAAYPGDGIDTLLEDLYDLRSGGATTPIYTIGLGDEPDHSALNGLASATGGRHRAISGPEEIADVYSLISDYFTATEQVCTEIPDEVCGPMWVKASWTWTDGEETLTGEVIQEVEVDCPVEATGRTAVVLLTLANPGIDEDLAGQLAQQAVAWTSPVAEPQVLLILDENHHDEFFWDADYIADLLLDRGVAVTRLDEEAAGVGLDDLSSYDVIWYSNPGYPPDDAASIDALQAFSATGGGLVLQGDDMGWSFGNAFSMQPLTHLVWQDNGTGFCGHYTNDNAGDAYRVTLGDSDHPLIAGLQGQSFTYGDDIDTTTQEDQAEILATATLDGSDACDTVPVIVAYTP